MSTADRDGSRREAAAPTKGNGHAQPRSNGVRAGRRRSKPEPERGSRSQPENAIRESTRPVREPKRHNGAKKHLATSPEQQATRGRPNADTRTDGGGVPPEIEKRFVRVGREFYFPDGARAFTDRGRRLTTPSENTEVIKSLIEIARARGWQEVVLTGTERFRKEAWLASQAAGLTARGYRPTEFERAHSVRARARASTREQAAADRPARSAAAARGNRAEERQKGWIHGRLLDHGVAKYQDDPTKQVSYFVKLETEQGERTIWGVDLGRALKHSLSQPKVGDAVGLRAVQREAVTVKTPVVNERGDVVGSEEASRRRNRWVIERQGFLQQRAAAARVFADAKVDAREGARRHPELLGSYLQLQSARALAQQRIRDPQDQRQFVERIRKVLAQSIARGEPLAPVRLREASARPAAPSPRRAAERDAPLAR